MAKIPFGICIRYANFGIHHQHHQPLLITNHSQPLLLDYVLLTSTSHHEPLLYNRMSSTVTGIAGIALCVAFFGNRTARAELFQLRKGLAGFVHWCPHASVHKCHLPKPRQPSGSHNFVSIIFQVPWTATSQSNDTYTTEQENNATNRNLERFILCLVNK